jgi:hypothetical protein
VVWLELAGLANYWIVPALGNAASMESRWRAFTAAW